MTIICEYGYNDAGRIFCKEAGGPCAHIRRCAVSGQYRQTELALLCPVRRKANGEDKREKDHPGDPVDV